MEPQAVSSELAPAALGAYSQPIRRGETIYVSGQLPIDPATGKLVEGGIREQTRRIFENIRAIVEAAGQNSRPLGALIGADAVAAVGR